MSALAASQSLKLRRLQAHLPHHLTQCLDLSNSNDILDVIIAAKPELELCLITIPSSTTPSSKEGAINEPIKISQCFVCGCGVFYLPLAELAKIAKENSQAVPKAGNWL